MNWEAIGAIGEILGAAAVFASLIYLAIQIKSSSKIATGESEREVWSKWIEAVHALAGAPESASINSRGFSNPEKLSAEEHFTFSGDLGQVVNTHHMIWRMREDGLVRADLMSLCDEVLVNFISSPGGRDWWPKAKAWYQPDYQAYVDAKLTDGAALPMDAFLKSISAVPEHPPS